MTSYAPLRKQAEGGVEFTFQFVWLRKGAVKRNHVSFKTVAAVSMFCCCVLMGELLINPCIGGGLLLRVVRGAGACDWPTVDVSSGVRPRDGRPHA